MAPSLWAQLDQQNQAQNAPPPPSVFAPTEMTGPPPQMPATPSTAPQIARMPTLGEQQIAQTHGDLQKIREEKARPWGFAGAEPSAEFPQGLAPNHNTKLGKIAHVFSNIGNIAGDIFAPAVMANIPGTQMHRDIMEQGLTGQLNKEIGDESLNQEREANTAKLNQDTADLKNKPTPLDPDRAKTITTDKGIEQWNPATSRYDIPAGNAAPKAAEAPLTDVPNLQKSLEDRYQVLNPNKPLPPQYQLPPNATAKDYERVDKALESVEKATGTLAQQQQANALRQQAMEMSRERLDNSESKATKPTADEQRRSDLAENLNENLNALTDIVQRRPELFGPLAGRWAELKQKFGSDDADLGALQTIEHQIGMAQISAHGMRSAQGVQAATDSILNHMHSGPRSLLAGIEAAQNSVKTFTGDVERATGHPAQPNPEVHGGNSDLVYDDKGTPHRYKGTGSRNDPNSYEAVKQ